MRGLGRYAACLMAALAVTAMGAHGASAAGVVLKNETETGFAAVYCVNDQGETKQVTGKLAAGASVTVAPGKLPEYECNRMAIAVGKDMAWQFYQEPEPGGAAELSFSMDKANPAATPYPSLLISSGGDDYVSPAGVPLAMLVQAMAHGLDEAAWKKAAAPLLDPGKNLAFAVSFADISWDLQKPLAFKELAPGKRLADELDLTGWFSNPIVLATLEGLKGFDCVPQRASLKDKKVEFKDSDTADAKWEAVYALLGEAADSEGGNLQIAFAHETFTITLTLKLDESKAALHIKRKQGAPLG